MSEDRLEKFILKSLKHEYVKNINKYIEDVIGIGLDYQTLLKDKGYRDNFVEKAIAMWKSNKGDTVLRVLASMFMAPYLNYVLSSIVKNESSANFHIEREELLCISMESITNEQLYQFNFFANSLLSTIFPCYTTKKPPPEELCMNLLQLEEAWKC